MTYSIHCTSYTLRRTLYVVHYTMYNIHTVYVVHIRSTIISYIIHCTLYDLHIISYTVRCTLYVVHCTSYSARRTMYVVHIRSYSVCRIRSAYYTNIVRSPGNTDHTFEVSEATEVKKKPTKTRNSIYQTDHYPAA